MKTIMGTSALALTLFAYQAAAADVEPLVTKAPKKAPVSWWDTFKVYGHLEAGVTFNSTNPPDGLNFGHLFTDKANQPLLNQFMLTAERPLDPKATGYDFGFKVQAMYGSDARYTHFLGEFDKAINDRNQIDIVEAHVLYHLPWFTSGGVDVKVGQYVTLEGAETIYPQTNLFYSHSYIFNFGIPFKHTGIMTTTHVDSVLDLYLGVDSGVNTTIGCCRGDNNRYAAFHGGIGLNLMGGALTILATTHIGPENPQNTLGINVAAARWLNDLTATWKVNDNLTLITDVNYIRDDGFGATGYGWAQYAAYKINDVFKFVARGEIWRDNNAFFVNAFPGNFDFVNSELGLPATVISGGVTTYGAITVGLNITPPVPKAVEGLVIRPEIRYDASLNGTTPFAAGTKSSQFTFGGDIIIPFTIR